MEVILEAFDNRLPILTGVILIALGLIGLLVEGPMSALKGFATLQVHSSRLISDFTVIGGTGAALFNAALVGAIGLTLTLASGIRLSGPTLAAIFTMVGFALFGKTPLNGMPIMLGVYLAALAAGKPFKSYLLIALFGTALGPLVSFLAFEFSAAGEQTLLIGTAGGLATGFILPSLALSMLKLHEGYNLYNIGLTAGFYGLFAAALLAAFGHEPMPHLVWGTEAQPVLIALIPALSVILLGAALWFDGSRLWKNLTALQTLSGRLPSDFMDMASPGSTLANMSALGIIGWALVLAVGGNFNGPVLGGLLTLMGFGAFGKNLRNCLPVMAGVFLGTLAFGLSPSDPGPLLALLFATTLAPIAGVYGPIAGLVSGFIHLSLVLRTASWHGGLDLYNNGFSGGLTATFVMAVINWYTTAKREGKRT